MEINVNKIVNKVTFSIDGKLSNEQLRNLKHQVSCTILEAMSSIPSIKKLTADCLINEIEIKGE